MNLDFGVTLELPNVVNPVRIATTPMPEFSKIRELFASEFLSGLRAPNGKLAAENFDDAQIAAVAEALKFILGDGARQKKEIESTFERLGVKYVPLRRARERCGGQVTRAGVTWFWYLPST